MKNNPPGFRETFAEVMQEKRAETGKCLDTDQLIRYHEGDLIHAEKERLEGHLLFCVDCFSRLQDLESMPDTVPLRKQQVSGAASVTWPTGLPAISAKTESWRLLAAMAASFLLPVIVLVPWIVAQHRALRDPALSQPEPNSLVADLIVDRSRGRDDSPQTLEVPEESSITLILTPDDSPESKEYLLKILDADRRELLSVAGLIKDPRSETLSFRLPPDFLPVGEYRFELYGLGQGPGQPVITYSVRIIRPGFEP